MTLIDKGPFCSCFAGKRDHVQKNMASISRFRRISCRTLPALFWIQGYFKGAPEIPFRLRDKDKASDILEMTRIIYVQDNSWLTSTISLSTLARKPLGVRIFVVAQWWLEMISYFGLRTIIAARSMNFLTGLRWIWSKNCVVNIGHATWLNESML